MEKVIAEHEDAWINLTEAYLWECPECKTPNLVYYEDRNYGELEKACVECKKSFIVAPDETY